MRKFLVNVNGASYEVEVEELGAGMRPAAPRAVPAAPVAAPAPVQAAAPAPVAAAPAAPAAPAPAPVAAAAGQQTIECPMPGNILDIKVAVGDAVSEGQTILILEAMKMENEIMAPSAGKVVAINCAKGAAVNAGDKLVILG